MGILPYLWLTFTEVRNVVSQIRSPSAQLKGLEAAAQNIMQVNSPVQLYHCHLEFLLSYFALFTLAVGIGRCVRRLAVSGISTRKMRRAGHTTQVGYIISCLMTFMQAVHLIWPSNSKGKQNHLNRRLHLNIYSQNEHSVTRLLESVSLGNGFRFISDGLAAPLPLKKNRVLRARKRLRERH